jgi:hypothetical protein
MRSKPRGDYLARIAQMDNRQRGLALRSRMRSVTSINVEFMAGLLALGLVTGPWEFR